MSGSCLQVGAMHITPGYTHPSKDPQFDVSHTRLPSNLLFLHLFDEQRYPVTCMSASCLQPVVCTLPGD